MVLVDTSGRLYLQDMVSLVTNLQHIDLFCSLLLSMLERKKKQCFEKRSIRSQVFFNLHYFSRISRHL